MNVHFLPSNLQILSGGHNFVTPAANFCDQMPGLFHWTSKKFLTNSLLNIFSFDVILSKEEVNVMFFKDLYFVRFCDKLI
jgi:hypothetical protein